MVNSCKEAVTKAVIKKVEAIGRLSGIPYSEYKTGRAKMHLVKLYQRYDTIKKNVNKPFFKGEKEAFYAELAQLFDISKTNAIDLVKSDKLRSKIAIKTDILFYEDQKGSRKWQ